ncbi:MAG: hypothetical protein Q4B14_03390 [Clostridia bacterium]|nr:hypothetical protein [Clostridia bacterium]
MDFFIHCEAMVYHHAIRVYIISPLGLYIITPSGVYQNRLRNDDMQSVALMIYNSFGIDDIHGFAVI